MCMMVYLGSAKPLALIAWNEERHAFHVCELPPEENRVRRQFPRQSVVYVGSHEGCGCGFQCGPCPLDYYDPAELAEKRASLRDLAKYLEGELPRVGSISVFACWDGDQELEPEHRRGLTPDDLRRDGFYFLQKELSLFGEVSECAARQPVAAN